MQLDFQQLQRDSFGRLEPPTLLLKKPHGAIIGTLGDYFGLKLELKYNEISEGSFSYPKSTGHGDTPFYDQLVPDKLIQIDPYGVFIVREATETTDGLKLIKEVSLYSLEYELAGKKAILGQGTYPLWNIADKENCLLYMALENTRHWSVGYVDANIAQRYRTFSDTDSGVLEFLQGEVQESYGAVVVFDTYTRTVNVYDASKPAQMMPVYLSYENLLKEGTIKALGENLITKLYVQGADGVDIRNVNPTGENHIYNLDWYIENGDLDDALADKWRDWQLTIASQQDYYAGLVLMRAAATSRQVAERVKLTDIENAIATQENLQSAWLQMKQTGTDPKTAQTKLNEIKSAITQLNKQRTEQNSLLQEVKQQISQYASDISALNKELKYANYFTESELAQLDCYFKEDTLQDDTFAVFDVEIGDMGAFYSADQLSLSWQGVISDAVHIQATTATVSNVLYALSPAGGNIAPNVTITAENGSWTHSAPFVSGVVDTQNKVATLVLGAGSAFQGGTMTITGGTLSMGRSGSVVLPELITQASIYFTSNATDYQQRTVEQSLYDHAMEHLVEAAYPTYEFEVSSGNILFEQAFQPFADSIYLGGRCYLQLDEERCLTPVLLEIHIDFEAPNSFSLVFANTFRRPDNVNSLKDILRETTSASRTLKSKELAYSENNNTTTWVKELLDRGFDAAMTRINSGESSVSFGKSGIKVESTEGDIIYLGNGMIALHDSTSDEVRMAMGHFKDASGDDYVGVLADVIAGTLVAGQRLIIECPEVDADGAATGVMQFKVDSTGVSIHNGSFYMQKNGRAVCIDPVRGFMLGKEGMLTWKDGVPSTSWGNDGDGTWADFQDQDDVSVWLNKNGEAHLKGNFYAKDIYAEDGTFTGVVKAKDVKTVDGKSMFNALTQKFKADHLELDGCLTITGLENGSTVIDGGWIKTGSILADLIKAGVLQSKDGKTFNLNFDKGTFSMQASGQFISPDGKTAISVENDTLVLSERDHENDTWLDKIRIGFMHGPSPDGTIEAEYPYMLFGNAGAMQVGLLKKFWNGFWLGNSAPQDINGEFGGVTGAAGIFVNTETGKTYVVDGTNMQEVAKGSATAKFK